MNVIFWIIVVLAVSATAIFAMRLLVLRRSHMDYADFIHGVGNILANGNPDEAVAICAETGLPVAKIVGAALRHRNGSARALREAVDAAGRAEVGRFARRLSPLAMIAQAAPLLSLLGAIRSLSVTVLKLNSYVLFPRGELLSGVSESMNVIFAGVFTALLAQMMYAFLRMRLDRLTAELEAAASEIISFLTARREETRK